MLLLASGSPRRRALLEGAGLPLEIFAPQCDEQWRPGEAAIDYAARVAQDKARAAREQLPERLRAKGHEWMLAADTTVWIPQEPAPLGKPSSREGAQKTLRALFDAREHRVSTAFCILRGPTGQVAHSQVVTSKIWMRRPKDTELQRYLDTEEWSDKAGGYGIQGAAAGLVERIEGSYTNVVGLPLAELLEALASLQEPRE